VVSVVVTIVDGGVALTRCLDALRSQKDAPAMEVLVPFDDSVPAMGPVASSFPGVRFIDLGTIRTTRPKTTGLGQHELFDRRRAAGLAAATGELVAILEDRGAPRAGWAAAFARLHRDRPHAVIGGAIENGSPRVLNRAVYFADFGRYQLPFQPRVSGFASDVNVCYKRAALEAVKSAWTGRYHEPVVHRALIRRGETIFLSPEPVVEQQRGELRLGALCQERISWGRLYGELRVRGTRWPGRLLRIASSPLVPAVVFVRLLGDRLIRRGTLLPFLAAAPYVALLVCAWSVGEATGYLVSRGDPARRV
jgi:hypothetical protein